MGTRGIAQGIGCIPIVEIRIVGIETGRAEEVTLFYPPTTGNHQYRYTKGGKPYLIPSVSAYRLQARELAKHITKYHEPVKVDYTITVPDRRRRDIGNVLKIVDDALVFAGVLADDSLIAELTARKKSLKETYG